jgi:ABC-type transport system involved in cytochrome c biogenesis permease component
VVAFLGNVGFASVGVLVSALTTGCSRRGGLLALVLLPLTTPVLLATAEATRLLVTCGSADRWWLWVQLLGVFVVLFTTLGLLMFESAVED